MLRIYKYLKPKEWGYFACLVVCIAFAVCMSLTLPDYMTSVTQLVETGGSMHDIWIAGIKMVLCALGDAVGSIAGTYFSSMIASGLSYTLRSKVYNKVVSFSMEEIGAFSTSSLVTRTTNDINQIQMVTGLGMTVLLRSPIAAIWAICKIVNKGWQWTLVTAIAVAVLIAVIVVNMMMVMPKFKLIQKLTDNLNRIMRENLTGVRVVRAYNAESYQEDKFDKANMEITKNHLFTGKAMAFLMPAMQAVNSGTALAIYWVGAYLVMNAAGAEKITIFSQMVVFMAYAMQVIIAFMMLSMIFIFMPRAAVSANRIHEVLDTKSHINDGGLAEMPKEKGTVEFKNVTFRYPDAEEAEAALEGISFKAEAGQTVAFIGSTGSGKSTLVNLVPRFYDVSEGQVLVDGVDVKKYDQKDLHDKLGFVPQKAILFRGDLSSNVAYGEEPENVKDEDIVRAMNIAQGSEIIEASEDGIHREVAQGGSNFSGGQKQRICIARAVYRRPEIFVFDDSFSALDYKTDKKLRSVLKHETEGATTLIVAQRIGTVKDADQIIVLDEGRMAGIGTHAELMKNCEVYRQIAYSQLSKEELENA